LQAAILTLKGKSEQIFKQEGKGLNSSRQPVIVSVVADPVVVE
jgi:hypothetical protein